MTLQRGELMKLSLFSVIADQSCRHRWAPSFALFHPVDCIRRDLQLLFSHMTLFLMQSEVSPALFIQSAYSASRSDKHSAVMLVTVVASQMCRWRIGSKARHRFQSWRCEPSSTPANTPVCPGSLHIMRQSSQHSSVLSPGRLSMLHGPEQSSHKDPHVSYDCLTSPTLPDHLWIYIHTICAIKVKWNVSHYFWGVLITSVHVYSCLLLDPFLPVLIVKMRLCETSVFPVTELTQFCHINLQIIV